MDLFSDKKQELLKISEIDVTKIGGRVSTTISTLDRALGGVDPEGTGGGFARGSVVLFGGEPGVGKSTLLLQILDAMTLSGLRCVYDSAEESAEQLKLAAQRCKVSSDFVIGNISVVEDLGRTVLDYGADILVVDSIQGFTSQTCDKRPGSITQLGVSCDVMIKFAKDSSIPLVIICQLTADGGFKGPKSLEHNVDVVGKLVHGSDPNRYRVLTFSKNRFGPTLVQNQFPWLHEFGRYDFSPGAISGATEAVHSQRERVVKPMALRAPLHKQETIQSPPISGDLLVELAGLKFSEYRHQSAALLLSILTSVRNQKGTHFYVSEDHAPIFGLSKEKMQEFLARASLDPEITTRSKSPWTILV